MYNTIGEIILEDHSSQQNYVVSNHSLRQGLYIIKITDSLEVSKIKIIIK
jgi:hypothetical protein